MADFLLIRVSWRRLLEHPYFAESCCSLWDAVASLVSSWQLEGRSKNSTGNTGTVLDLPGYRFLMQRGLPFGQKGVGSALPQNGGAALLGESLYSHSKSWSLLQKFD